MANRYFVNGGVDNNWGTTGNWSTTSGGGGGSSVPSASDDVFLDASSPNCVINTGGTRVCRQFDATGYTNTLTFNTTLTATPQSTGVFKFAAGMTLAGSSQLTISAPTSGICTITSAGLAITMPLRLGGNSSTMALADAWDVNAALTLGDSGSSNVTYSGNSITAAGSLTVVAICLGTTTLTLDGTGTWSQSGGALSLAMTINTAGTITVSGTVTVRNGSITYTAGTVTTTGSTLTLDGTATLNCASITWNNITTTAGATTTLSANVTISGTLACAYVIGAVHTINGNTMNIGGSLTVDANGQLLTGTTVLNLNGTGTMSCASTSSRISSPITINTGGTITLSGTFTYHTGTFTYTAGTLAGASTPIFNINSGTATVLNWGGANFGPWKLQITTAGVIVKLSSGIVIPATASLLFTGTAASVVGFKSSSTPTQRTLNIVAGASIDVGYCDFTDINAAGGDKLWVFKGTLSNVSNIALLTPYTSPIVGYVGGSSGGASGSFG